MIMNKIKTLVALSLMAYMPQMMAQSLTLEVRVTNKWEKSKEYEPIVIRLADVKKLTFDVKSAVVTIGGREIPCQLDDMDGDMKADELVFVDGQLGDNTQVYKCVLSAEEGQHDYPAQVYADLMLDDKKQKHPFITSVEAPGKSYIYSDLYHHGVAMENVYAAYRVYFDHRQNIDIYGKKLYRLELAETHFYADAAHLAQDYGNDVLWAGNSIGCGSMKDWDGTSPQNLVDVDIRGQRIIASGPVRTVAEVKDYGWQKAGATGKINMRQRYILYAGHREMQVQLLFDRPLGDEEFCTGVQKVGVTAADSARLGHEPRGMQQADGIAATWGCDFPEMGQKALFPPEPVGLAVYVPQQYIKATKEDELNYLYVIGAKGQTSLIYYVSFCADKERKGYHSADEWFATMESWQQRMDHPCEVKVKIIK